MRPVRDRCGSRSRGGRRRAALCVLLAAVTGVVGCGLPEDSEPRVVQADRVPFGLLGPSSTAPSDIAAPGDERADVYLVLDERLVSVDRDLEEATPASVLSALLEGKTETDPPGAETSIPAETALASPPVLQDDGTLVVDLVGGITNIQGDILREAFAQLVWTATSVSGVRQVRFLFNGQEDVEVVTDQASVADPVDRDDFQRLRPLPTTTTTTGPRERSPRSSTGGNTS